jgi:hypothetical protein
MLQALVIQRDFAVHTLPPIRLWPKGMKDSMRKFVALARGCRMVVTASTHSAPDSAFASSFLGGAPGQLPGSHWSVLPIFAGNQLGTTLACDVVPSPLKEHQQFVIEANQIGDVHKQPQYPCQETMQMQAAEIGDASMAPDDHQVPFIVLAKRLQVFLPQPLADEPADIATLLHGHRR